MGRESLVYRGYIVGRRRTDYSAHVQTHVHRAAAMIQRCVRTGLTPTASALHGTARMAEQYHRIRIKRAYEPPIRGDGVRLLVDRLWPRGLRNDDARFDAWRKDLAPSTELRQFYGHQPERFAEFTRRYRRELQAETKTAVAEVLEIARRRPITLLTATRDLERSGAAVLATYLEERGRSRGARRR
jgi:uncharacterized protein YeaO (DUF488 family)